MTFYAIAWDAEKRYGTHSLETVDTNTSQAFVGSNALFENHF